MLKFALRAQNGRKRVQVFVLSFALRCAVHMLLSRYSFTLGDKNMADNLITAKNNGGKKYGGIPEKSPTF